MEATIEQRETLIIEERDQITRGSSQLYNMSVEAGAHAASLFSQNLSLASFERLIVSRYDLIGSIQRLSAHLAPEVFSWAALEGLEHPTSARLIVLVNPSNLRQGFGVKVASALIERWFQGKRDGNIIADIDSSNLAATAFFQEKLPRSLTSFAGSVDVLNPYTIKHSDKKRHELVIKR
jgi:hypothetical protein